MNATPVKKTRRILPPASWPEEAQQLYWNFYDFVSLSRTGPYRYLIQLEPFFKHQEQEGLSYREYPQSLISVYIEQSTIYTRPSIASTLRLWLKFLYRHKQLLMPLHEDVPRYPTIRRRRPTLSHSQILRILELPPLDEPLGIRDRAFLELAYATGMRRSELAALTLGDVDMTAWRVHIGKSKNGYQRTAPMTKPAREFLLLYLSQARPQLTTPLSPNSLWLNRFGRSMSSHNVMDRFRRIYRVREILGFKVFLHQFRHACATHLLEGSAPLMAVAELLGHRCLENTKIYTHVTALRLRTVHDRCHPRNNGLIQGN